MWYGIILLMSFIPKQVREAEKERSYRLNRWQERAVFGMLGMITLSFVMSNLWAMWWHKSDWLVATVLPAVVVDLTNQSRVEADTVRLSRNSLLDKAARMKAEHMAEEGYFAHYSPTGVTPWHWFTEVGYNYQYAGENLAVHFTDSEAVVESWLNSPSHRDNIINNSFTEIGVGTAKGRYQGYETVFVVQMFGTPVEEQSSREESNDSDVDGNLLNNVSDPVSSIANSEVAGTSTTESTTKQQTSTSSSDYQFTDTESGGIEQVDQWVSDTATTSVSQTELQQNFIATKTATGGSTLGVLATKPNTILQWVYILLAILTVGMLLWALRLEIHQRRLLQIGYSFGLLFMMGAMWYIHTLITGSVVIG